MIPNDLFQQKSTCSRQTELDTQPHRRWFADNIRAAFPQPERVFVMTRPQVYAIGDSSLVEFVELYTEHITTRQGVIRTRGGDVFFLLQPVTTCAQPTPDDVFFLLEITVNEARIATVPHARMY